VQTLTGSKVIKGMSSITTDWGNNRVAHPPYLG